MGLRELSEFCGGGRFPLSYIELLIEKLEGQNGE
jgi:hypothetical protein